MRLRYESLRTQCWSYLHIMKFNLREPISYPIEDSTITFSAFISCIYSSMMRMPRRIKHCLGHELPTNVKKKEFPKLYQENAGNSGSNLLHNQFLVFHLAVRSFMRINPKTANKMKEKKHEIKALFTQGSTSK